MKISEMILELIQRQIEYGDIKVGIKVSEKIYDVNNIYCWNEQIETSGQVKILVVLSK
jgi:hypothetical protein